jgi:hypothetical protein
MSIPKIWFFVMAGGGLEDGPRGFGLWPSKRTLPFQAVKTPADQGTIPAGVVSDKRSVNSVGCVKHTTGKRG